ncbi:MANSC domain-containing protein 4-like [Cololabis saira]|uniref:MANSC domain-containing protein 4-like n=1 Tax=Cololabis saira TaxID=129043 RepID=UPI002AD46686|nr:MANSC domain-containing protein 4-like [Cololabis saira]
MHLLRVSHCDTPGHRLPPGNTEHLLCFLAHQLNDAAPASPARLCFPAMSAARGLLALLALLCHAESRCSPTAYYQDCWIRQFPGVFLDVGESQRRGAQLLRFYLEDSALKCSRSCCVMRNLSCNLAMFHYDNTQENCFHLHCPTLESCILRHGGNTVLYNISNGVDPDLLVFGKYFASNVRVLPHHYSRVNASDPLPSDKRQFIHPPPPAVPPLTSAPSAKLSTPERGGRPATAEQSSSRFTTVPAATAASSSSGKAPPSSASHAQTAPTASATSTAPSFTSTVPSSRHDGPRTSPTFSTTSKRPSTRITTHHHATSDLQLTSSPTAATNSTQSSRQDANNTQVGGDGQKVGGEDAVAAFGPGWHMAAHTLLVAVAICATVLLSCCCLVMLLVSWRGQRKRMGRYRTSCRGKSGSMRLIKYVLVRENC